MEKFITATTETREQIIKVFSGISRQTIWRALHFKDMNKGTDTERRIRKMALNRGGIVMAVSPEMEMVHDADGYMRQCFSNGVMLEACKKTGVVEIRDKRGEVKGRWENPRITEFKAIQEMAQSL